MGVKSGSTVLEKGEKKVTREMRCVVGLEKKKKKFLYLV